MIFFRNVPDLCFIGLFAVFGCQVLLSTESAPIYHRMTLNLGQHKQTNGYIYVHAMMHGGVALVYDSKMKKCYQFELIVVSVWKLSIDAVNMQEIENDWKSYIIVRIWIDVNCNLKYYTCIWLKMWIINAKKSIFINKILLFK